MLLYSTVATVLLCTVVQYINIQSAFSGVFVLFSISIENRDSETVLVQYCTRTPYRFCHAEFEAAKTRSCDTLGTKSITTIFHFFILSL